MAATASASPIGLRTHQRDRAALPTQLAPQLATLVDAIPEGDDWLYEMKFDGYRLLTRIDGGRVQCFTRNGHDWSGRVPHLVRAIRDAGWPSGWVDGEIVVMRGHVPDFQALQNAFDQHQTASIRYQLFDVPFLDGRDLREWPLLQRRERLARLFDSVRDECLGFSEAFSAATGADPAVLLASAREAGLEGLIGKRQDAPYVSGRNTDWIKLKTLLRQEFVIGGYTDPQGARQGLGALLLGVHDASGALRYAGNVGSGFTEASLRELQQRLRPLKVERSPFADAPARVGTTRRAVPHWIKPSLMGEVSFAQWTSDRRVRHAVFHGLRDDKPPRAIGIERAAKAATAVAVPGVRVTHPERVVDKRSGVTKGELVAYYDSVAGLLLPHLSDRPVALLRAPAGVNGGQFFQKHAQATSIPGLKLLDRALDPDHEALLSVTTRKALLSCAQMNVVELHSWNTTVRHIRRPDRMVFDLDPGQGVAWVQVQEAARLLKNFLAELKLEGFLKTSGGKGLHVVVPLTPRYDCDQVKSISHAIVTHLAKVIPQRFVAKSGPDNRVGRIFIDYLRNGFGATTVAAWSARARAGLGVSVPVSWDELDELQSGAHWTVQTIARRIAVGDAPWKEYAGARQGLAAAVKALRGLGLELQDDKESTR